MNRFSRSRVPNTLQHFGMQSSGLVKARECHHHHHPAHKQKASYAVASGCLSFLFILNGLSR